MYIYIYLYIDIYIYIFIYIYIYIGTEPQTLRELISCTSTPLTDRPARSIEKR